MDKDFERLIKVNVQGRVFATCQAHGVADPRVIDYYIEITEQAVLAQLSDESTTDDFQQSLKDQISWLEGELTQASANQPPLPAAPVEEEPEIPEAIAETPPPAKEAKKPTGYVPDAKSMPERLKDRRAIMEHLLDNDCITLKLVTPDKAKKFKHGLAGKIPEKAEEEVVTILRDVLYSQVRNFIRQHNGGPWSSAMQQHELRLDITKTRTLRSLVTLAHELLNEREEWLQKTKGSLTGRFFSGRVKMDK